MLTSSDDTVRERNPYLHEFTRLQAELNAAPDYANQVHRIRGMSAYERRVWCVRRYAFAVPTEPALATVARYGPIVELGAGTGYWTHLLRQRGVDCVAYDLAPPDRGSNPNAFQPFTWTSVIQGGVEVLAAHAERALLLCWPSYRSPFGAQALAAYGGTIVIYIGEPAGGHTADDTFFERLASQWQPVESVALPNWPGTCDVLTVFRRVDQVAVSSNRSTHLTLE